MNPLTLEWIQKADGDLVTAEREYRARRNPNYDAAYFHAQQTVEKYLKAWMQESGQVIPRIHSLVELVSICLETDPTYAMIEPDLRGLDIYAVRTRYPGQNASKEEARSAVRIARRVKDFVVNKFNMS